MTARIARIGVGLVIAGGWLVAVPGAGAVTVSTFDSEDATGRKSELVVINHFDRLNVPDDDGDDELVTVTDSIGCEPQRRLCGISIKANEPVLERSPSCTGDGTRTVQCAYLRGGTGTDDYRIQVSLGNGADRLRIRERTDGGASEPWNWTVDFGRGDDDVDLADTVQGPVTGVVLKAGDGADTMRGSLTAPGGSGAARLELRGGAGNDTITTGNGGGYTGFSADGEGGDDTVTLSEGNAGLAGGAGNDTLTASGRLTSVGLDGGAGADRLAIVPANGLTTGFHSEHGGDGADTLTLPPFLSEVDAGGGDDTVVMPDAALRGPTAGVPVTLAGGDGRDRIDYRGASAGARIALADSDSSGNARLVGFEDATGTSGDDVITGTSGDNAIDGHGGRDTVTSLAGNDVIDVADLPKLGFTGTDDTVDAGAGRDTIKAGDGFSDAITCGSSLSLQPVVVNHQVVQMLREDLDTASLDLVDPATTDCENVSRQPRAAAPAAQVQGGPLHASHGVVSVSLRCPAIAGSEGCRGRALMLAPDGREADVAALRHGVRYAMRAGAARRVRLRVPTSVREAVAADRIAPARVALSEREPDGRLRLRQRVLVVT